MSVVHKNYGPVVNVPRASPTGGDSREVIGSVKTASGDVQIVDTLTDGTVRRRKATPGMTLRQGDTVLAGEGSGAIDLANSKRFVYVMSNSSCFVS